MLVICSQMTVLTDFGHTGSAAVWTHIDLAGWRNVYMTCFLSYRHSLLLKIVSCIDLFASHPMSIPV